MSKFISHFWMNKKSLHRINSQNSLKQEQVWVPSVCDLVNERVGWKNISDVGNIFWSKISTRSEPKIWAHSINRILWRLISWNWFTQNCEASHSEVWQANADSKSFIDIKIFANLKISYTFSLWFIRGLKLRKLTERLTNETGHKWFWWGYGYDP